MLLGYLNMIPRRCYGMMQIILGNSQRLVTVVGHSNLIAITLGGDALGMFEIALPIPRGMEAGSSDFGKGWTRPVLIGKVPVTRLDPRTNTSR
jgi:hypothetical protein